MKSARKVLGLMELNPKQAGTSVNVILKVLPDHFKIHDRLAWSLCLKKNVVDISQLVLCFCVGSS